MPKIKSLTGYLSKPHNQMHDGKSEAQEGIVICPACHAVYCDKHWHSSEVFYNTYRHHGEIRRELCPEDKTTADERTGWSGEVVLKNIRPELKIEILEQARNIGKRAMRRDPEEKILKIIDAGREVRILTSENQLAAALGKEIAAAHKGGKVQIKWSRDDKPCRVIWTAK